MTLLDTNVIIYQSQGKLSERLKGEDFGVSVITQIEVLGHPAISPEGDAALRSLLGSLETIYLSDLIVEQAIKLRRTTKLRLPDAIIAATALATGSKLITNDADLLRLLGVDASAPHLL